MHKLGARSYPFKQEADELIDLFKEKIKHLDTKKKNTFELKEGKSALKQFATQYGIGLEGKAGYDAESFLREDKSHFVDKLKRVYFVRRLWLQYVCFSSLLFKQFYRIYASTVRECWFMDTV